MKMKKVMLGAGVVLVVMVLLSGGAHSLTYQDEVDVEFTFDPTINVTLSSADLIIEKLMPGTADKSNTISVNVSTNSSYGYTLSASVGDGVTYQDSNLTDSDSGGTPFSSLATSDNLTLANFQNNQWGYTLASSFDSGTTYSGLSYGTEKIINSTRNLNGGASIGYIGGNSTSFTIGAKAPVGQVTGEYTNVINFTAVANVTPLTCNPSGKTIGSIVCMQDLNGGNYSSVLASMTKNAQYQLIDNRDDSLYFVSKLEEQDGDHIWMTQNLDLCIGCSGTAALTSDNTDLNVSGTGAYVSGYTKDANNKITWTPASTAISSTYTVSSTGVDDGPVSPAFAGTWDEPVSGANVPYSAEAGEIYYYTSGSAANDTVYNSLAACVAAGHSASDCMHYHAGNYYNWSAAVASNDTSSFTVDDPYAQYNEFVEFEKAENSICPSGWRLPAGMETNQVSEAYREYGDLFYSNGITDSMVSDLYATNGFNTLRSAPLYFIRPGYIETSYLRAPSYMSAYWTNTFRNSDDGSDLIIDRYSPSTNGSNYRDRGESVRCVARYQTLTISDMEYMQDFADLSAADKQSVIDSMEPNHNYPIKDSRDTGEKATARYTIAKLVKNTTIGGDYQEVWMTTNLDLAGGTHLTHEDTDIPADYTINATGFTNNTLPASNANFSSGSAATVYNSGSTTCGDNVPCYSYYSWIAATAGGKDANGTAVTSNGYNAPYSICPAGWRLPTTTTSNASATTRPNWKTGDFYALATAYGANLESIYYQSSGAFYNNAGPTTIIPKFLFGGYYQGSSFDYGGSLGYYWSATSNSSSDAYNLYFSSSDIYLASYNSRGFGFSVRCMLRE